jgi:hypothetical protein
VFNGAVVANHRRCAEYRVRPNNFPVGAKQFAVKSKQFPIGMTTGIRLHPSDFAMQFEAVRTFELRNSRHLPVEPGI